MRTTPITNTLRACALTLPLVLVATVSVSYGPARASSCSTESSGIDTSKATSHDGIYFGEAIGQTFFASDSLISSITVWRWAGEDTNYAGWHLYIADTDSLGRPNTNAIILDGPSIYNFFGDGIHHIPFRFVFDPPFALPHRGTFEFAVQAVPCSGTFIFLLDHNNDYADGQVWLHGRSGCTLRANPDGFAAVDLVFSVEFCIPLTPVSPTSWGRLKATYH